MMTSIVKHQSLPVLLNGFVQADMSVHECKISDISMDSRHVMPGCLFLSLAKQEKQRQQHLQQALDKGAFAVAYDAEAELTQTEQQILDEAVVNAYPVSRLGEQAGYLAARFYDQPSSALTVIAVTGTNGKTSVTQFLAQALESLGQPCGIIGTLGTGRICDLELTGMTTPDPVSIQRFLAGFKAQSCPYVVMEASSHALEQGRLNSVEIDVAVLTNLTRDHLDYHKTMEAYSAAKAKLFEFSSVKTVVLNMDDEFGQQLKQSINNQVDVLTYASEQAADIIAADIQCTRDGLSFDVTKPSMQYAVHSSLLGRFNVDNLLATAAVLYSLGYEQDQVKKSVEHCHAVSGRMQAYGEQHQPMVVIDYAHTPDALEQALMTLRAHLPDNGQLWCVFGCGGDRDKGKRSLMGNIAETLADMVVVTDDNPRTEDHIAIVKDILSGCAEPEKVHVEHDRKQAIIFAINHAHEQDIILVAGKGHEAYQEINQVKYPFCDATVVSDHLLTLASGVQNLARAH